MQHLIDEARGALGEGARDAEGNALKVGDRVGFKSDVEQYGKIKKIRGSGSRAQLTLVPLGSGTFEGDYIGGQRVTDVIAGDVDID
jgi:hypothetical protein